MTDIERLENLLKNAPQPAVPANLLERMEKDIVLPEQPSARGPTGNSRLRYWFPAVSLAASAAILAIVAVVFLSPAPVAYSLEKTVEALRNTQSVLVVHKYRHGPPQPLKEAAVGVGTTSHHPANPFASVEMRSQVRDGREMLHAHGNGRKTIRNGPLGLTENLETGERNFYLLGSGASPETAFLNPEDWLLQLQEQQRKGEVEFEVLDKIDSAGNMQVIVRPRVFEEDEFMRLWVNARNYLPVRIQVVSTGFPEFGAEVVMNEIELLDYGIEFDDAFFAIEPTDAELQKFGLSRAEVANLPSGTTSIEIEGDAGTRFIGSIIDGSGKREIAGSLPVIFVENPIGEMYIDLWAESRERETFKVSIGGGDFMTRAERIAIFLTDAGHTRGISSVPVDVKDVEAFMKRNR